MPRQISRRTFLKTVTALSTSAALPPWFVAQTLDAATPARSLGANERPNLALIGCGGQGRGIAKKAARFANVVALCDVDTERLATAAKDHAGAKPMKDFREVIARDDLHGILNATPDHWHTLINLARDRAAARMSTAKSRSP